MVSEGAVFTVGHWTVKPGKEAAFLKRWHEFARWTMDHQAGAKWVYMVRDLTQANKFLSFGPFESAEMVEAWRKTPEFKAAFVEFKDLCDEIRPGTMREVAHLQR